MAAPKRFYVEQIADEMTLSAEESRHAKNVLRLSEGDEVTLFDGSGREYSAVVDSVARDAVHVHVVREAVSDREPGICVTLLIGALKGDKTELVVQKATELGVMRIGVFSSRYCAAYMNENKLERLRRVANESLEEALRAGEDSRNKLFACEFLPAGGKGLGRLQDSVCAVVGSEGGFFEEEYETARRLGYAGISLGRRILRAETAAIALASVIMYAAGELQ